MHSHKIKIKNMTHARKVAKKDAKYKYFSVLTLKLKASFVFTNAISFVSQIFVVKVGCGSSCLVNYFWC